MVNVDLKAAFVLLKSIGATVKLCMFSNWVREQKGLPYKKKVL